MPADASIYGLIRPQPVVAYEQPEERQLRQLKLRSLLGAEEMQRMQIDEARRVMATNRTIQDLMAGRPDLQGDALINEVAKHDWQRAQQMREQALKNRKTTAEAVGAEGQNNERSMRMVGGAFANLAQAPTHEGVMRTLDTLRASGAIQEDGYRQLIGRIPADPAQLKAYVDGVVTMTEHGLKTLQARAPEVTMVDTGAGITPYNKNTLAGPVAPIAGAATVKKELSPAERDASARGWANLNQPVWDSERGVFVPRPQNQGGGGATAGTRQSGQVAGAPIPVPGLQPKLPESSKKELASLDAQANTVAAAIEGAKKTPSAFGLARGMATMAGSIPETLAGRMDSKEQREARAFVFNVVSKVINERAGAAQSVQELARLRAFLPAEGDNAEQIVDKLTGFQNYLAEQRRAYAVAPGDPRALRPAADGAEVVPTPDPRKAVPGSEPVKISGDDGYNALPSGALFVGPDGKTRRKP